MLFRPHRPTWSRRRICLSLGLLIALGTATTGCGRAGVTVYPVTGRVTYKGMAIQRGTVLFSPLDAKLPPARGVIEADGSYRLTTFRDGDGAVAGEHRVIVNALEEVAPGLETGQPGYRTPTSLVPDKYSNLNTTPLQRTIAAQKNVVDLEL